MKYIDLRSDTVTVPTPEMRKAMANAEVGDDVYGEDPSINKLQALAAEKLGKEAGLFVPSGTMGNLLSVLTHCNRGDEIIIGNISHIFLFEAGGASALGGVFVATLPNLPDGTLDLAAIEGAVRKDDPHHPISRLVVLENTHNRCGASPISAKYTADVAKVATKHDLSLHIDGARLFNAAAALNTSADKLVKHADSVTICLSKGLCAPVGSVVCGSKEFIRKGLRIRKQLGGGMRQAGIIAAAGIVALEKMTDRLAEDHVRAKALADSLAKVPGLSLVYQTPPSNMVFVDLAPEVKQDAPQVAAKMLALGIKVGVVGARRFRLVTHYWIKDADIAKTVKAFKSVL